MTAYHAIIVLECAFFAKLPRCGGHGCVCKHKAAVGFQGFAEFVFLHQRDPGHTAGLFEGVAFYEDGLVPKEFVEPFP